MLRHGGFAPGDAERPCKLLAVDPDARMSEQRPVNHVVMVGMAHQDVRNIGGRYTVLREPGFKHAPKSEAATVQDDGTAVPSQDEHGALTQTAMFLCLPRVSIDEGIELPTATLPLHDVLLL